MQFLLIIGVLLVSYVLGSIPNGLLIVKIATGKDVRQIESGRTGGTNVLRAAGFFPGLMTALLDILKGACAVWLTKSLLPNDAWIHIMSAIAAIIGHNYSVFMPDFDENKKFLRFRGGAGGAPALGGAIGLWAPIALLILPLGAIVYFTVGYASVTTLSIAVFAMLVFGVKYLINPSNPDNPIPYVLYGLFAAVLLAWALKPNFIKLAAGTERVISISLHGWLKKRKENK